MRDAEPRRHARGVPWDICDTCLTEAHNIGQVVCIGNASYFETSDRTRKMSIEIENAITIHFMELEPQTR